MRSIHILSTHILPLMRSRYTLSICSRHGMGPLVEALKGSPSVGWSRVQIRRIRVSIEQGICALYTLDKIGGNEGYHVYLICILGELVHAVYLLYIEKQFRLLMNSEHMLNVSILPLSSTCTPLMLTSAELQRNPCRAVSPY